MKKVSLLILLVVVLSTVLMAATPTKMVRLTMINKTGFELYMKLEGSAVTEAFYYLTVPTGDADSPSVKVFTVMSDVYDRTTWQCDGVQSSGTLTVDGNIRLTFLPCGRGDFIKLIYANGVTTLVPLFVPNAQGEPRMEKVTRFRWLQKGLPVWANADLYNGYWNWGCFTFFWRLRTYSRPDGCWFRYQY